MEPLEKLTADDLDMFDSARREYVGGSEPPADLSYVLRFWNRNKQFLFDAFGQNLILSKEVKISNQEAVRQDLEELVKDFNYDLVRPVRLYFQNCKYQWSPPTWFNINPIEVLMDIENLRRNSWDATSTLVLPNGDKIQGSCKLMKAWKKVLNCMRQENSPYYEGLEEVFEQFRLSHSRTLNMKDCETTLYLSIHPLDYITMSDNNCNWSSCMSWCNDGEYRHGTVEMMNSPYVVLAYTCGNSPLNIYDGQWNNKNWRQNIIVHPDIISCCTEYPCSNPTLRELSMEWVYNIFSKYYHYQQDELILTRNCSVDYPYCVRFRTHHMYNDFGCNKIYSYLADTFDNGEKIVYSGESECMWCGGTDIQEPWHLFCDDCNPMNTYACACCGDLVPAGELDEDGYCYGCSHSDEDEDEDGEDDW